MWPGVDNFKNLAEWSRAVRVRDGCCLRCQTTVALVAHHIKPKSVFPELRLSLENGETLCSNCHSEHHKDDSVVQSAEKRGLKKAKIAILRAENAALKQELEAMRKDRRTDIVDRQELARLRAALVEYENAYQAMTAWDTPETV